MRLIDADKLIEQGWRLERHGQSNELVGVMSLADVPTAFDVKTVTITLMGHRLYLCDAIKCSKKCNICMFHNFFREQLEIIRKGGVKND